MYALYVKRLSEAICADRRFFILIEPYPNKGRR